MKKQAENQNLQWTPLPPEKGRVQASLCAKGWPWASPLKAEMEAIRMGVETAWAMGYKNMLIGTDSEGVVRLLQSDSLGPPQMTFNQHYSIVGHVSELKNVSEDESFRPNRSDKTTD
ncbi:hypothetical protein QJS10_CPA05g01856 [Acorus calamus]|uniref:RNase H type-1 domain-containing protein n=1 Tax=Acorus calamus TaxID=4465 RepID=A0AAV9EW14_ACOCL|nr:hypothetical protein QJS10_CPA05g01856 [Acorus calamus]